MAATAEINVRLEIPEKETVDLLKALAEEVAVLYNYLDTLAENLGQPAFPRNQELLGRLKAFIEQLRIES